MIFNSYIKYINLEYHFDYDQVKYLHEFIHDNVNHNGYRYNIPVWWQLQYSCTLECPYVRCKGNVDDVKGTPIKSMDH